MSLYRGNTTMDIVRRSKVKLSDWTEYMGLPPMMAGLIRALAMAKCPDLVDVDFTLRFDQEAGVLRLLGDGVPVWEPTFEEVENLANSESERPADMVPGGPGAGSGGVPGQDPD